MRRDNGDGDEGSVAVGTHVQQRISYPRIVGPSGGLQFRAMLHDGKSYRFWRSRVDPVLGA